MKKLLLGIGIGIGVVTALTFSPVIDFEPVDRTSATSSEVASCPDGSYLIGYDKDGVNPICKLEPTGCPYGDSIPLGPDCDKHAPENQNNSNEGNTNGTSEVYDTRSTESKEEHATSCYSGK